jgi:uncharacterized repeat protein (TIGR02543 family)
MAEYLFQTGAAGAGTQEAYFNMVYAPFGTDDAAWQERASYYATPITSGTAPEWVIRNGLNDDEQDEDTDFARYDGTDASTGNVNANGALSVGVVAAGGVAAQGWGLYEDNNPWPLTIPAPNTMTGHDGDLKRALSYLNTTAVAAQARYGSYTIALGENETDIGDITLGGGDDDPDNGTYGNIKDINVIVSVPGNDPLDGLGHVTENDGNSFGEAGQPGSGTTFAIRFLNYDDSALQEAPWSYNTWPSYTGTAPTRPADAQYSYAFSNWSPAIVRVTKDADYTAQFTPTTRQYTITFTGDGGATLHEGLWNYGATPSYAGTPTKGSSDQYSYAFSGWDPAIAAVTTDAEYTAQFSQTTRQYTLTFDSHEGSAVTAATVNYNTQVSAPTPPTRSGYAFNGWFDAASGGTVLVWPLTITADRTVHAQWTLKYSVTTSVTGGTGGSISPASASLVAGATQSFTVTAETGKKLKSVTASAGTWAKTSDAATTGVGFTGASTWQLTMPASNVTITAEFEDAGPNLDSWTAITPGDVNGTTSTFGTSNVNAVAYGDNKFVAVGNSGKMAYSTNGTSWTAIPNGATDGSTSTFDSSNITDIAYGNGTFIAVGYSAKMAYSTNGTSWTKVTADTQFGIAHIATIAYVGGKFVAGGTAGKMAYSTNDGVSWNAISSSQSKFGTYAINGISYGAGKFVAVGGLKMSWSTEGTTSWNEITSDVSTFNSSSTYDMAFGNGIFVAGGMSGRMAWSASGTSWNALSAGTGSGTSGFDSTDTIASIAYVGGKFVAGGSNGKMAQSADGTGWTPISTTAFGTSMIYGIAYGAGKFVAVGSGGMIAYTN